MMRGSSGGDFSLTVIPITRSMIFWEASEVCKWLEHLSFDQQVNEGKQGRGVCGFGWVHCCMTAAMPV